jgi:septum formation protein
MASRPEPLVLASASVARADLLRAAGIEFIVDPAEIDEGWTKRESRRAGGSAIGCAVALAAAKAFVVSRRHPNALVIGADQLLTIDKEWFDKPTDLAAARARLLELRARSHALETAVCVVCDGRMLWHATSSPELTMRPFSDAFLDQYLASEGESLLLSVGAYRLEGMGAQLFERINGDYFAVLGLPLLELLEFLRERGVMPT